MVATLTRLFHETSEASGGARANPAKRREMENNSRRLGALFAKLNTADISANASLKLIQLCQALDARDYSSALQIQVRMSIVLSIYFHIAVVWVGVVHPWWHISLCPGWVDYKWLWRVRFLASYVEANDQNSSELDEMILWMRSETSPSPPLMNCTLWAFFRPLGRWEEMCIGIVPSGSLPFYLWWISWL